jgi:hypothetical protein
MHRHHQHDLQDDAHDGGSNQNPKIYQEPLREKGLSFSALCDGDQIAHRGIKRFCLWFMPPTLPESAHDRRLRNRLLRFSPDSR